MSCSTLESGILKPLSLSFQLQPPPTCLQETQWWRCWRQILLRRKKRLQRKVEEELKTAWRGGISRLQEAWRSLKHTLSLSLGVQKGSRFGSLKEYFVRRVWSPGLELAVWRALQGCTLKFLFEGVATCSIQLKSVLQGLAAWRMDLEGVAACSIQLKLAATAAFSFFKWALQRVTFSLGFAAPWMTLAQLSFWGLFKPQVFLKTCFEFNSLRTLFRPWLSAASWRRLQVPLRCLGGF